MKILVIDIGGTNVKVWKTGEADRAKFPSGKSLTPELLVKGVREVAADWHFDRVSIGYPGHITHGRPSADPYNLGGGWVGFDYATAFGVPVRIMNDACMQALGSYEGGIMLYLGLGTSIGTTLIQNNHIVPLALGHLKFRREENFEQALGRAGLKRLGAKRWRKAVIEAATQLKYAFLVDYVVLGGGNVKKLEEIPDFCRRGGNQNAYFGGVRMWEDVKEESPRPLSLFPQAAPAASAI